MDNICRFLLYIILFIVVYQYFTSVTEGHTNDGGCGGLNEIDCNLNTPNCYWGDNQVCE